MDKILEKIRENMDIKNNYLAPYATRDSEAYRFKNRIDDDFRTAFSRDSDRIIYSLAYTRYMDKTQVFSFNDNDNVSKRMTHVQMVSKNARAIGRALKLNEDLIEAAALGHDLGHVPFGHAGERILNKLSLEYGEGFFNHNVQSVRTLMNVENNGIGCNITLQVLDAIMCHNGELELKMYKPKKKTKEEFLEEYNNTYKDKDAVKKLVPMTLEGCVVRVSDIIAYIGRDVEDAIRLGLISIDEIPNEITSVLGVTNGEIINTINLDIISHSLDKDYLCMSERVFQAMKALKQFNFDNIYVKVNSKERLEFYETVFRTVFEKYLDDIKNNNKDSRIYTIFLNSMAQEYLDNTSDARKVIDYIAGMTDDFIVSEYDRIVN